MATKSEKKEIKPKQSAAAPQAGAGRMMTPFEEMDRWFEGVFPRSWLRPFQREWPAWAEVAMPFEGRLPKVDVIERDNEVVIKAELPGVKREDVDVSITDTSVCIKGRSSHESKEEKGDYYRREMSRGEFSRTLSLPAGVERDKAKARFTDGILEIVVPKQETAKRHNIKVE